jgi:hypothetical protein
MLRRRISGRIALPTAKLDFSALMVSTNSPGGRIELIDPASRANHRTRTGTIEIVRCGHEGEHHYAVVRSC